MVEGVAQYREIKAQPLTIFIGEQAIKNMDPSFAGCPVYVRHVDEVDLANIQEEADGYVSESFYNKSDGKHWVKFVVVSDKGHEAIRNGWRLSNCYTKKKWVNGGLWHGVEYHEEITEGEYDHLAIVPNPRYEESIIMTPEQFKRYNGEKELQLQKLANSNEQGEKPMLSFFKKSKVENSADYEGLAVILPKSKKEMTISELVSEMDAIKVSNMAGYANDEHMVKVGEEEMSVKNLVKKHMAACNEISEMSKKNEDEDAGDVENESEEDDDKEKKKNNKKKNEADVEEARKVEEKKIADEALAKKDKEEGDEHFKTLKNAPDEAMKKGAEEKAAAENIDTSEDKVARGASRYGR